MRIAFVQDFYGFPLNGAAVSSRRFAQALTGRGFRFVVLCAEGGEGSAEGVEQVCFPWLSLLGFNGIIRKMHAPIAKPVGSAVARALAGVDVLHVQLTTPLGFVAMREARAAGIPVVCTFNVQPENLLLSVGLRNRRLARALYRIAVERFYQRADVVIAPSCFAADVLRRHGLEAPVRVISNGVPEEFFVAPVTVRDGRFRVLAVGRLSRDKRLETLVRAIRRSAFHARVHLQCVGVGPDRRRLERLAKRLALSAEFASVDRPTLIDRYRAADLFVHSSAVELEGMSVLEAMASATTVVVSDAELSASAGFATRPEASFMADDAADLATKIDFWLERDSERLHQGRENQKVARRHAHALSVEALAGVYRELRR